MNKKRVNAKIRAQVMERAGGYCEYCRTASRYSDTPFDIDHCLPESKDGASETENLALACHGCNLFKTNRTDFSDPATNINARLFNPRTDLWADHFVWTRDAIEIVGLTSTGRATMH